MSCNGTPYARRLILEILSVISGTTANNLEIAPGSKLSPESLTLPLFKVLRPTRSIGIEGSLSAAAEKLRLNGTSALPVLQFGDYAGVITESALLRAIEQGASLDDLLEPYIESGTVLPPQAIGSDAARLLASAPELVVVDESGQVRGMVLPSDLFPKVPFRMRPTNIGGMATPFGVYLTTGTVSGGASKWGLVATGTTMAALLVAGHILSYGVLLPLDKTALSAAAKDTLSSIFSLGLFGLLLHFMPLAGYHAAEHQVVHAIERDEHLTPTLVARMPRVHPRCGTNLAVAVMMFFTIAFANFGQPDWVSALQVPLALIVTVAFWRPLGSLAQQWVTTRKASAKQIEAGICSGNEILKNYEEARSTRQTPWKQLWNMGLLHVFMGSACTYAVAYWFFRLIGRPELLPL